MRKKFLSLVLVMTLVLAYAVPVAATEADAQLPEGATAEVVATEQAVKIASAPGDTESVVPNGSESTDVVSEDPKVQQVYDSYLKMMEAFNNNEYDTMKTAYKEYEDLTLDLTDEQSEEWNKVVEANGGVEEVLANSFTVATIIYTVDLSEAYQEEPNAKSAKEFVEYYDDCIESEINMEQMCPGIEAVYKAAKDDMPSDNVLKVFDAYAELAYQLETAWWGEDFVAACNGFESVLDIFNELNEEELNDLAELMGVEDAEAAWTKVFSDWINANLVLQISEPYEKFLADENAETAKAYIDAYDSVANDTELLTDEDKEVILAFFADGSYELAKSYLVEESKDESETGEPAQNADSSPETGDDFNAAPYAALMVIAAAVAGLAVKRRKVQ